MRASPVRPTRTGPAAAEAQLAEFVRATGILLVLDNCEHLADACARLAHRLLRSSDALHVLATSRKPLQVPGEVVWPVPPLALPAASAPPEQLHDYDAIRLFAQRAADASHAFRLDRETAPTVAEICRQLDGVPLAIELAAARVRTLPVRAIAARLDDRFRLLTAGPRTVDARQQTMWATVEWSHQLLTESERVVFRRLAVFRGGWSLEAAEGACAGAGLDRTAILDVLARLVDHSLVVADHGDGGHRFRMLETLRQFALVRLAEAGERERILAQHARYFTAVAEGAERQLRGPQQARWATWLRTEDDNLRAALQWCRDSVAAEPDLGLRLAATMGWLSYFASRQDSARELTEMLATAGNAAPAVRARALQAKALVARPAACIVHPDADCAAAARESLDAFTRLGDAHRAALSKTFLAVEGVSGREVAASLDLLAEADQAFSAASDTWGRALVRFVRMELHFTLGDLDAAMSDADSALATFRTLGDQWAVAAIPYHRGLALHRAGRLEAALDSYEEALTEARRLGRANTVQYTLANLGHVRVALGDRARAEHDFAASHAIARELGADGNPLACLGEALLGRRRGDVAYAQDRYTEALRLLNAQANPDWTSAALSGLASVSELADELESARLGVIDKAFRPDSGQVAAVAAHLA